MVISRETDYSIRILRILADEQQHVISEICKTEQIPRQFGYKIVEKLQDSGIVACTKGKGGGVRLSKDLHDVTLLDVMQAVGNDFCMNQCLVEGHECPWQLNHDGACRVHPKLAFLQEEINAKLMSLDMYSVMFGE